MKSCIRTCRKRRKRNSLCNESVPGIPGHFRYRETVLRAGDRLAAAGRFLPDIFCQTSEKEIDNKRMIVYY